MLGPDFSRLSVRWVRPVSSPQPPRDVDRRTLLRAGGAVAFQALLAATAGARQSSARRRFAGYGPLTAVADDRTGLPLLRLPWGFRYVSFGWQGDPLTVGGTPTPGKHDGMGVITPGPIVTLVRNHEVHGVNTSFGPPALTYDPNGGAGATRLTFDTVTGEWLTSEIGLAGTAASCAGGVTPWGSWLTCEETIAYPFQGYGRTHGWVFEVPAAGAAQPVAFEDMGRFRHEAVCVDPATSCIYETEDDRYTSGFYRFRPLVTQPAVDLAAGGTLEMLKVQGVMNADLQLVTAGQSFPVEWVPIADPRLAPQSGVGPFGSNDGQTTEASGPFVQGDALGGARFRRLEGCWFDEPEQRIYLVDTEGGLAQRGTIWRYDPLTELIEVLYASPGARVLDKPDNITVSPRGGVLFCEDGSQERQRLHALSAAGQLSVFAENNVVLNGEVNGLSGNYRDSEWAGACFDPTGQWLFVNVFSPGITFAITGPWTRGPL